MCWSLVCYPFCELIIWVVIKIVNFIHCTYSILIIKKYKKNFYSKNDFSLWILGTKGASEDARFFENATVLLHTFKNIFNALPYLVFLLSFYNVVVNVLRKECYSLPLPSCLFSCCNSTPQHHILKMNNNKGLAFDPLSQWETRVP